METSKHSLASYIGDLKQTLYLTHRCTHVSMLNDNTLLIAADKENAEKRISLDKIRRLVIIGHIGNVDSEADRAPKIGLVERFNFGLLPRFNLSLVARFNFGLPNII